MSLTSTMRPVSHHQSVDDLIAAHAPVAIGVSGGKDSQAAALATIAHLDAVGHQGPRLLVHADLGIVEWNDSLPICVELGTHLGVELAIVKRKAGGLMERWEARWASSRKRYEELSTVTLVPCWSTPKMRFCTSEMKTHVICADLKRRFPGQVIVNATGVRRDESAQRARKPVADLSSDGRFWNWRPILDWSEADVFASIDGAGIRPHPAYRQFGMSRVSCRFCIMQSLPDQRAAIAQPEARDLFIRMVRLEAVSTFGFQGSRWLADIAPDVLPPDLREQAQEAKRRARIRAAAEESITKDMLYVKGWPTRMLTNDEADILARVRRQVSDLMGFESQCLDRRSIHGRYAELIAAREAA